MSSKYGFETDKDNEQNNILEQLNTARCIIASRIDPIIRDIFTDYLTNTSFKDPLGNVVEKNYINIVFTENHRISYWEREIALNKSKWEISFSNNNKILMDPYNREEEIKSWHQDFQISVGLVLLRDKKPKVYISAFYKLVMDESPLRQKDDTFELPQITQLEKKIAEHAQVSIIDVPTIGLIDLWIEEIIS